MQTENPAKTWMLLVSVLLVAPVLSGCFGGDEAPEADDGLGENVVVNGEGGAKPGSNVSKTTDHSGAKNEPSAHYHHYWGEPALESVTIYDGKVPFNNWDNRYLEHWTLAWAEFGLEDDENDVRDPATDQPISPEGIADTVFAGADRIVVKFPDEFPPGVSSMLFFYKASHTPLFEPEGGKLVTPGSTVEIKLDEVGMTDPPHQFTTSRWKFRLFAHNEVCDNFNLEDECPPAFIQDAPQDAQQGSTYEWGSRGSGVEMTAYNGGVKALDPPHPDFWGGVETIELGNAEGEVTDPAVQTPIVRERISSMTDISMPPNNIVPLGTDYVEVRVKSENSAPAGENVQLKLYYHGADTIEWSEATDAEADGEWMVYKIRDELGTLVDPPYESNSFWRFKLVPTMDVGGTPQENLGAFQGKWFMEFRAHKIPGYILT